MSQFTNFKSVFYFALLIKLCWFKLCDGAHRLAGTFPAEVASGCFGFLPHSKDMPVRLIDDSKLPIAVNVTMNGCLSLYVGPVNCEAASRPMSAENLALPDPAQDKWCRQWMDAG